MIADKQLLKLIPAEQDTEIILQEIKEHLDTTLTDSEQLTQAKEILKNYITETTEDLESLHDKARAEAKAFEQQQLQKLAENINPDTNIAEIYKRRLEIVEEIKNYNPCLEICSWTTIFNLLNQNKFNVINFSNSGTGKSRSTIELFNLFSLPNTIIKAGHLTPRVIFGLFKAYPTANILIDEGEISEQAVSILRSALYNGEVVWESDRGKEQVNFDGSLIINTNELYKSLMRILDRVFYNSIYLSVDDIKLKSESRQNYKQNKELWDLIKDRVILLRAKKQDIKLTAQEKGYINALIESYISHLPRNTPLSMRLFERAETIFRNIKLFFGTLDKDLLEFGRTLSQHYICYANPLSQEETLIVELANSGQPIEAQAQEFISKTGLSRRSYFGKKKKLGI